MILVFCATINPALSLVSTSFPARDGDGGDDARAWLASRLGPLDEDGGAAFVLAATGKPGDHVQVMRAGVPVAVLVRGAS